MRNHFIGQSRGFTSIEHLYYDDHLLKTVLNVDAQHCKNKIKKLFISQQRFSHHTEVSPCGTKHTPVPLLPYDKHIIMLCSVTC